MIEIEYSPIKKIIIQEKINYPREDFLSQIVLAMKTGQPNILNWAAGNLFVYSPLHIENDKILEEYLKGTIYWSNLAYSTMEKYEKIVKIEGYEIPIIDVSHNTTLKNVANWIKSNL